MRLLLTLCMLAPVGALAQANIATECARFAERVVQLAPIRAEEPDEDIAHAMVPYPPGSNERALAHWMLRLVYRHAPQELRAAALQACLKHHAKPA